MTAVARAAVLPFLIFLCWELLARTHVAPEAASRPSSIARALVAQLADGSLLSLTYQTLLAASAGWAIGVVAAIVAGIAIGTLPLVRIIVGPALNLTRSIPPVALIPVALLAFGLGPKLEIVMVAFAVFWPVVLLTAAGVASVDARLLEVARALRFSPAARAVTFILPAASPNIAVAIRLAAGIALVIAVTTEIIASPTGLGNGISFASTTLRPDIMFADLAWLAVIGFAINLGLARIERRTFGWVRR
jgi:ABC-type nitrate/sulfonate/bicarbonate transport system permease component